MTALTTGETATGRFVHAVPAGAERALCGIPVMTSTAPFEPERASACPRCRKAVAR
jgi:hypothetical protein